MATYKANSESLDILIKKCISRNRKACEELYKVYYPKLMPTVRRYISDSMVAEEVLHNAFVKIFDNLKQYDYRGSFEGWMRRICFHCVSDYIRSTTKYREHEFSTEETYQFTISEDVTQNLDYNFYLQLIDQLPDTQKAVFNLYVIDGFKHKEIAKMLEIPEGTSKWNLSQARQTLQHKIQELKKI